MSFMEIEQIKKDLRRLSKLSRNIEVMLIMRERHEKRKELLLRGTPDENTKNEIEKIDRILASLHISEQIKEASALEERYMVAINRLEPLDKIIILDGYINGKAYWKIGRDIGYTEDGIKKRIKKSIEQLAKML